MKILDWSLTPKIMWEKRLCPICEEPTGPNSECFDKNKDEEFALHAYEDTDIENIFRSKTIEYKGDIVPIFGQQCIYRRYNDFYITVNYPFSHNLVENIASIEGIEKIIVDSKYKACVSIGILFEENDVKSKVNKVFKSFIHRMKDRLDQKLEVQEQEKSSSKLKSLFAIDNKKE